MKSLLGLLRTHPKLVLLALLGSVLAIGLVVLAAHWIIVSSARGRTFDDPTGLPHRKVALVLGTAPKLADGRTNLFFQYRIDAAVKLLSSGKVDALLVSGDNGSRGYDEPTAFQDQLMAQGVPQDKIHLDYAGFRTLDSIVRAREVFGQDSFIVVSQKFHNERAVYLAKHFGIDAIGFNAQEVVGAKGLKTKLREYLARCKVFVDLWLGVQPRFLGEQVKIPDPG